MAKLYAALCVAIVLLVSLPAICGHDNLHPVRLSGEKLDSGLGSLPPYLEWQNHPGLRGMVRTARMHRLKVTKRQDG